MALQSSGEIKLSQVATEFGSDGSTQLTDYNRGGGQVPESPSTTGISGTDAGLKLSQFYAKSSVFFSSWNIAGDRNFRVGGPSSTWGTFTRDVTVNLTKANDTGSPINFDVYGDASGNADTLQNVSIPVGQSSSTVGLSVVTGSESSAYDQLINVRSDYGNSGNILLNFYACKYRFTFSYNIQTSLGYLWNGTFDFDTRESTGYLWTGTFKQDEREEIETTVTEEYWTGEFKYRSVTTVTNSCRNSDCSCQTFKSCTNSACGCQTYKTCQTSGCGTTTTYSAGKTAPGFNECFDARRADVQAYCRSNPCTNCQFPTTTTNTCADPACGCKTYKTCRTSGCGCETYNVCQSASKCGTSPVYGPTQQAGAAESFSDAGPYDNESDALNGEGFKDFNNTGCKSSTPGSCDQDSAVQQVWDVGATVTKTDSSTTTTYGDWEFVQTYTAFTDAGPYATESDALDGEGFEDFNNTGCKSSTPGSCDQDTDTIRTYAVGATQGAEQYTDWVKQPNQLAFENAGPYKTQTEAFNSATNPNGDTISQFNTVGCKSATPGSCQEDTATSRFYNVQVTQGAEQFGTESRTAVTGDGGDGGNIEYITHVEGAPLGSAIAAKEGFTGVITITSAVKSNSNDSNCPTSGETQV